MNKTFMFLLGITLICATIGLVASKTDVPSSLSPAFLSVAGIGLLLTILTGLIPKLWEHLRKEAAIWLMFGAGLGLIAFLLAKLGNYQSASLIFATCASVSLISAISQGFFANIRKSSLLAIVFDFTIYVPITWMILGGTNAFFQMLGAPVADQVANVLPKEVAVFDTLIEIFKGMASLEMVKINGRMPFAHLILLIHQFYCLFRILRSYGWQFFASVIAAPFLAVIWVSHTPTGLALYMLSAASIITACIFAYRLKKHWHAPIA